MSTFIAIELAEPAKAVAKSLQCKLEESRTDVYRLEDLNDMHVTLYYLGHVDESACQAAIERCSGIAWEPFTLKTASTVPLPQPTIPKVLALSLQCPTRDLAKLQTRIHDAVFSVAAHKETRPFLPHVTVARLKHGVPPTAKAVKRAVASIGNPLVTEWTVDAFHLMKRTDATHGPRYETVFTFPAGSPEPDSL